MRNLSLLSLLFFLGLSACKNEAVPEPVTEQIVGKWKESRIFHAYYDESQRELYKEAHSGLNQEYIFGKESFAMNMSFYGPYTYSIVEQNGKHNMVIEKYPIDRPEITIAGDIMTWNWENLQTVDYQPFYYQPWTDTSEPAYRQTVRLEFKRVK
jgi:hypothetical protein